MNKRFCRMLAGLPALLTALLLWTAHTEPHAHWVVNTAATDLSAVLEKPAWNADDYRLLATQTGLFAPALDLLRAQSRLDEVPAVQKSYLTPAEVKCAASMLLTRSERLVNTRSKLAALEDGDILITACSHVLGWRNGHAGIVVDAANGTTLEAVVIGQDSSLQSVRRWTRFSSFAVYRLADTDTQTRTAIAQTARRRLSGVPYRLAVGLSQPKRMAGAVSGTQCAHLVWEAFSAFGYDLDENGGAIVTPADIARSPLLELKQVYGLPISFPD